MGGDWTLVGGNPAPGDADALRSAARAADRVCQEANDFAAQVRAILGGWSGAGWSGLAAGRFEELLLGVEGHLAQMEASHKPVAEALTTCATVLTEQQQIAAKALQQAETAQAERATASVRRTAAQGRYEEAAQTYGQVTDELAGIEGAIGTRMAELEQLAAHLLGEVSDMADPILTSLLGERVAKEAEQSAARAAMEVASTTISEMEALIAKAEDTLTAAVKLAEQVRTTMGSSARRAQSRIDGVDNGLRDVWHHVAQDAVRAPEGFADFTIGAASAEVAGVRQGINWAGREVVAHAPDIHAVTRMWAAEANHLADVVKDCGPYLPLICTVGGAVVGAAGGAVVGAVAGVPAGGVGAIPGAVEGGIEGLETGADVGHEIGALAPVAVEGMATEADLAEKGSDELMKMDGKGAQVDMTEDTETLKTNAAALTSDATEAELQLPGVDAAVTQYLRTGHWNLVRVVKSGIEEAVSDTFSEILAD